MRLAVATLQSRHRPVALLTAFMAIFFASCGPETAPERRAGSAAAKSVEEDRQEGADGGGGQETGKSGSTNDGGTGSGSAGGESAGSSGAGATAGGSKNGSGDKDGDTDDGDDRDGNGSDDEDGDSSSSSKNGDDLDEDSGSSGGSKKLSIKGGTESTNKRTDLTLTTKKYDKGGRVKVQIITEDDDEDDRWRTMTLPKSGSTTLKNVCFNGKRDTKIRIIFESDYKNTRVKPGSKDMRLKESSDRAMTLQIEQGGCFIAALCSGPDDDMFELSCAKSDLIVEDIND